MDQRDWQRWGRRLHDAYTRAGMSRASFARAIDVGYNTVWRWEQGENRPKPEALAAILHTLTPTSFLELFAGMDVDRSTSALLDQARGEATEHARGQRTVWDLLRRDREARAAGSRQAQPTPPELALHIADASIDWTPETIGTLSAAVLNLDAVRLATDAEEMTIALERARRDGDESAERAIAAELAAIVPRLVQATRDLLRRA